MTVKRIVLAVIVAMLPLAAGAATLIVPVAGSASNPNGSVLQSELMLHNTSALAVAATLVFHDQNGPAETAAIEIAPRATLCLDDVVASKFNRSAATGGIEINFPDSFSSKLAVTSRLFSKSAAGKIGQNIPALKATAASGEGKAIVINGPSDAAESRFDFGLFALADTTVRWELHRVDGSIAATAEAAYAAGSQTQYKGGVDSLLGSTQQDDDVMVAVITRGAALAYGSVVNLLTGDPTYVPGYETLPDIHANFAGIDYDFNGAVELADADHDGVLDQPLVLSFGLENTFQIVVNDPDVTFEQIPSDVQQVSIAADGTVSWIPTLQGMAGGTLKVRVTTGGVSDVISIPVKFK